MAQWIMPKRPRNIKELDQVSGKDFRTVILVIIQYYCLARVSDIRLLRACDLRLTDLDGQAAIEITFNKMKNDQLHIGSTAHIVKEGGDYCPYRLLKLYYARCAYFFQDGKINDLNYIMPRFRMAKVTKISIPDGRYNVSQSTLVNNIKMLAAKSGFRKKISGKSAKIGGTSAAYSNGLSETDIKEKGRWKSIESAQYYKRTTESYKLKLATAFSMQDQPWYLDSNLTPRGTSDSHLSRSKKANFSMASKSESLFRNDASLQSNFLSFFNYNME